MIQFPFQESILSIVPQIPEILGTILGTWAVWPLEASKAPSTLNHENQSPT